MSSRPGRWPLGRTAFCLSAIRSGRPCSRSIPKTRPATPNGAKYSLEGIDDKIADSLGTTADDILINDMAVNPASGTVYLSVSRGRGPDAIPVIVQVDSDGEIKQFALKDVAVRQGGTDQRAGEPRRPAKAVAAATSGSNRSPI